MPEKAEAQEPTQHGRSESASQELNEQHTKPQEPACHVQSVRAHQRKKRREEGTAIGAIASRYEIGKFVHLERQKHDTERGRDKKSDQRHELVASVACQHGDTARKAAGEQAGRFDKCVVRAEKHMPVRATIRRRSQHRERSEQCGKENAVAQKIEIEAKARDVLPGGSLVL